MKVIKLFKNVLIIIIIRLMEYDKYIHTFICVTPLIWGIYEFRKFRLQIENIKTRADEINSKIDDISNNNLDSYPFFKDLKDLVDKINSVFKPIMNEPSDTANL